MYIEDVLLGNSEYSVRVDELITALLHCDKSNLLSEILKHDKMGGGQFALEPPLQILGDSSPVPA